MKLITKFLALSMVFFMSLLILVNLLEETVSQMEIKQKRVEHTKTYWTYLNQTLMLYYNPSNPEVRGSKSFTFLEGDLINYGMDKAEILMTIPPADTLIKELVFVTAASEGYFASARESIGIVQKFYPNNRIIFYDLGVSGKNIKKFGNLPGVKMDDICNVEYRKFDYSRYPVHVKDKMKYAWKFLIIQEVLHTYPIIFWMDSSVKFQNAGLGELLRRKFSSPIMLSTYTGHNNFVVTHSETYSYLPTDTSRQKHVNQFEANNIFIVNTREAYENVLKWMYLCSLTQKCIAPVGAQPGCHGFGPDGQMHGRCHRFDQAALNILLSNYLDYNPEKYILGEEFHRIKPFRIMRGYSRPLKEHFLYVCVNGGKRIKHLVQGQNETRPKWISYRKISGGPTGVFTKKMHSRTQGYQHISPRRESPRLR